MNRGRRETLVVYVAPWQAEALRNLARTSFVPTSAEIRHLIERFLAERGIVEPAEVKAREP